MPLMRARRSSLGHPRESFAWTREFRLLLAGSYVSMFGSRITTIACPLLALYLTNSPAVAGLVAFAATAPSILVYIPAGALVDRWEPRRTMIICESGRGVAIAIITISLAVGRLSLLLLIGVVFTEEILEVFSTLAEQRYVRSLVPLDQAPSAQASIEARANAVVLAGRPVGAILFSIAHILPFLTDALSFVASVSTITRITSKRAVGPRPDTPSWQKQVWRLGRDITEGLRWLFNDRYARAAMTLSASSTLIGQALIMVFLAEAHTSGLSSVTVGFVLAASGGGGVLGAMVASRVPTPPKISLILVQLMAWAGAFAILAVSHQPSLLCLAFVMAAQSLTGALGNIEVATYLSRNVDENMLGRATSIGRLMAFSAYAVGPALGGILIQWHGAQHAVFALFWFTAAFALLGFCSPSMRRYYKAATPVPASSS
jgi:MFS family permease